MKFFLTPRSLAVFPAGCRPRSVFVYSFPIRWRSASPTGWKACPTAVCRPPSAVVIPHSLTVYFSLLLCLRAFVV